MALHPSLPPKPIFPDPKPQPLYAHDPEQPEASSSTPPKPLCAMCTHQYAKYTCPGCSMRTCSASCSSSHKAKTGCTGVRNKATYVPLNQYTWGKMMDDYVYLEEMGRKVGDWGKEIVRGGYMAGNNNAGNTRGRGDVRGRGRGMRGRDRGGAGASGPGKTKRDILKMQLEVRDIEMDLLPVGMERRKVNQSTWDFKNQTALLTIEFKFYKPKDPLAPSSQPREPPYMLLTHRNDTRTSLLSLIRSHVHHRGNSKKETAHPEWVKRLLYPDPDDPESFSNPQCVMAAQLDPIATRDSLIKKAHYSFDPAQPLAALLRHTQFVEIPTIEIWDEFTGAIVGAQGVVRQQQEERPQKRRRMNPKAGKLAIAGLLEGYGSDEDEEEPEPENVLAALGNYAGSDEDEDSGPANLEKGESNELDHADLEGLSDDGDDVEVDPAVLLELMRAARGGQPWAIEEDEAVDWGDMDDGELE